MKAEILLGLLLAVCVFGQESSSGCRYWCRSPEGQAFCCETDAQPISPPIAKPDYLGECPPVRPVCPATKFGPPKTCSSDGSCPGVEKCCYDRCLETTVCKTPIYPGGGPGGPTGGGSIGGPIGGGGNGRPIGGGGNGRPIVGGGNGRPIGGGGNGRPIGGGGQGGEIQHRPGPDVDLTDFLRKGPKP